MRGFKRSRRPGVWELVVYLGKDPLTGKPRYRSPTFHGGSRAADAALAALVPEVAGSTVSSGSPVVDAIAAWLDLQADAGLSPTTLRTYRSYVANWLRPILGDVKLPDLTAGHVRELHARMTRAGKSDSTIRQVHNILRGALAYALEHEWVDRNVAAMRPPPRQQAPDAAAPTLEELWRLLAAAGEPGCDLWACVSLAAVLGARAGELCALRWSDVTPEHVTISRSAYSVKGVVAEKQTKTRSTRRVELDDLARQILETRRLWQEDRWRRVHGSNHPTEMIADPYVLSFWSNGDGPPRPDSYSSAFRRLRNSLDLGRIHLHSLRHWSASWQLDQGVPLPVVSERLVHSSPAVTARIYAHAVPGRQKEAAAVLGRAVAQAEIGRA